MAKSLCLTIMGGIYCFKKNSWMDTNGCYYNSDAKPAGWVSLSTDFLHYEIYDLERNFVKEGENYFYTYNFKKFDPFFNLG